MITWGRNETIWIYLTPRYVIWQCILVHHWLSRQQHKSFDWILRHVITMVCSFYLYSTSFVVIGLERKLSEVGGGLYRNWNAMIKTELRMIISNSTLTVWPLDKDLNSSDEGLVNECSMDSRKRSRISLNGRGCLTTVLLLFVTIFELWWQSKTNPTCMQKNSSRIWW